jgi:Protein of unknown function (DUF4240)
MMNEDKFWEIIERLDWDQSSDEAVILPAINALAEYSVEDITTFDEILCEKIYRLDTQAHAENAFDEGLKGLHTDGFFEIRCAAIANGRECYELALADPKQMIKERYFAHVAAIPSKAYRLKTAQKLTYRTKYPITSQSNREGWGWSVLDFLEK